MVVSAMNAAMRLTGSRGQGAPRVSYLIKRHIFDNLFVSQQELVEA
jgi:hypothetical protein